MTSMANIEEFVEDVFRHSMLAGCSGAKLAGAVTTLHIHQLPDFYILTLASEFYSFRGAQFPSNSCESQ